MISVVARIFFLTAAASVFWLAAGRWDLRFAWAYWALWFTFFMVGMTVTLCTGWGRALAAERMKPGPGSIEKLRVVMLVTIPLFVGAWLVAGLDTRFGWSVVPSPVKFAALGCIVLGMGLNIWTVVTNPFASSVIRVQTERGHHVITTGPYRFVRHPMYLGGMLMLLFGGLALGSWWAQLLPLLLLALGVRRALREEAFLEENLDGYKAYTDRVRWHLVPGVW